MRAALEACTGVERLAIWLTTREMELHWLACNNDHLRPTHMSFDVNQQDWDDRPDSIKIFPESLTHLNLDCFTNQDIEDIPWQAMFAHCPNLAHISLSGSAVQHSSYDCTLFSLIVPPLLSLLPATVVVFAIVLSPHPHSLNRILEEQIDAISEASDRFVVVCHGMISPDAQVFGLQVFKEKHTLASEWGSWRGEDTWDLADKCIAARKRNPHIKRNTGMCSSYLEMSTYSCGVD